MDFFEEYIRGLNANIANDHDDNWDHQRFGDEPVADKSLRQKVKKLVRKQLNKYGFYNIKAMSNFSPSLKYYKYFFDALDSDEDKQLFMQLVLYRTLGHRKVKLSSNTKAYWDKFKLIDALIDKSDRVETGLETHPLYKTDLNAIGFPIKLYYNNAGIMLTFIVKHYEYNHGGINIAPQKNDIVIDAGSWCGDTALYFANAVGEHGRVYTFEFIPSNLTILERSLELNPELNKRINLVKQPLWFNSTTKVYYRSLGSGSFITMEDISDKDGECTTLSVDDLVRQNNIPVVNYVKMNIGGAEANVLKGAEETIKKFKPNLAITIFLKVEDFKNIPEYLSSIVPEYKFYFAHNRIHAEESILFATVKY